MEASGLSTSALQSQSLDECHDNAADNVLNSNNATNEEMDMDNCNVDGTNSEVVEPILCSSSSSNSSASAMVGMMLVMGGSVKADEYTQTENLRKIKKLECSSRPMFSSHQSKVKSPFVESNKNSSVQNAKNSFAQSIKNSFAQSIKNSFAQTTKNASVQNSKNSVAQSTKSSSVQSSLLDTISQKFMADSAGPVSTSDTTQSCSGYNAQAPYSTDLQTRTIDISHPSSSILYGRLPTDCSTLILPSNVLEHSHLETNEEVVVGGESGNDSDKQCVRLLSKPPNSKESLNIFTSSIGENHNLEDIDSTSNHLLNRKVSVEHSYSTGVDADDGCASSDTEHLLKELKPVKTAHLQMSVSTGLKKPIDIMMHKDKISILRQMSQIFNEEQPNVPEEISSASEDESQDKILFEKKNLEQSTPTAILHRQFLSTTKEFNNSIESLPDINKNRVEADEHTDDSVSMLRSDSDLESAESENVSELQSSENVVSSSVCDTIERVISGVTVETMSETNSTATPECENPIENNENTPSDVINDPGVNSSIGTLDEPIDDVDSSPLASSQQQTEETTKCDSKSIPKSNVINIDTNLLNDTTNIEKVYHVPTYSRIEKENISVESYEGEKGECVDIVDGFAFISCNTATELSALTGTPRNPLAKKMLTKRQRDMYRKKHGYQIDVLNETRDTSVEDDSASLLSYDSPNCLADGSNEINTAQKDEDVTFQKPLPVTRPSRSQSKTKLLEPKTASSSAFASNDLDDFLTKHSHLNISYDIPSCRITKDSVSKFDGRGARNSSHNEISTVMHSSLPSAKKIDFKYTIGSVSAKPKQSNFLSSPTSTFTVPKPVAADSKTVQYEIPKRSNVHILSEPPRCRTRTKLQENEAVCPDVFVHRAGSLVPLASIMHNSEARRAENKDDHAELVYVYDNGKLLMIGGSLCRVNTCKSKTITARVVLPEGCVAPKLPLSEKIDHNSLQAVYIDEKLATFALTALKKPTAPASKLIGASTATQKNDKPKWTNSKYLQDIKSRGSSFISSGSSAVTSATSFLSKTATRSNILDIISAKLSLPNFTKKDAADKSSINNKTLEKSIVNKFRKISKTSNSTSMRNSTLYKKNLHRFPSLSREMKRLDMNLVNLDMSMDESDTRRRCGPESDDDSDGSKVITPCSNEHCILGCVCDSLNYNNNRGAEHCGKPDCMLECSCPQQNWTTADNLSHGRRCFNAFSITRINNQQQHGLALQEKEFRHTLVNTGTEVIMCGGDRKRERKVPDRYRDAVYWKLFPDELGPQQTLLSHTTELDSGAPTDTHDDPATATHTATGTGTHTATGIATVDGVSTGEEVAEEEADSSPSYCMSPPHPIELERVGIISPSRSSRYIKPCRVDIPWFKLPSVSIWCMEHSCYDCDSGDDPSDDDCDESNSEADISNLDTTSHSDVKQANETLSTLHSFEKEREISKESDVHIKNNYTEDRLSEKISLEYECTEVSSEAQKSVKVSDLGDARLQALQNNAADTEAVAAAAGIAVEKEMKKVDHWNCTPPEDALYFDVQDRAKEGSSVSHKNNANTVKESSVPCKSNEKEKSNVEVLAECIMLEIYISYQTTENNGSPMSENIHKLVKHWSHSVDACSRSAGYSKRGTTYRLVADPSVKRFGYVYPKDEDCISNPTTKCCLAEYSEHGYIRDFQYSNGVLKYNGEECNEIYCANRGTEPKEPPKRRKPEHYYPLKKRKLSEEIAETVEAITPKSARIADPIDENNLPKYRLLYGKKPIMRLKKANNASGVKRVFASGAAKRSSALRNVPASTTAVTKVSGALMATSSKCNAFTGGASHVSAIFKPVVSEHPITVQTFASSGSAIIITSRPDAAITTFAGDHSALATCTSSASAFANKVSIADYISDDAVSANAVAATFRNTNSIASTPPASFAHTPTVATAASSTAKISGCSRVSASTVTALGPSMTGAGSAKLTASKLCLPEMMQAEERRGELELDLSCNTPGTALLVAEARFRKLINMNIIGVTGLNKASRCMIAPVESSEMLSKMRRIQTLISNRQLDVGPNMREIFFPPHQPPATASLKPKFVMIRCDIRRNWEIAGLVQKKSGENKHVVTDVEASSSNTTPARAVTSKTKAPETIPTAATLIPVAASIVRSTTRKVTSGVPVLPRTSVSSGVNNSILTIAQSNYHEPDQDPLSLETSLEANVESSGGDDIICTGRLPVVTGRGGVPSVSLSGTRSNTFNVTNGTGSLSSPISSTSSGNNSSTIPYILSTPTNNFSSIAAVQNIAGTISVRPSQNINCGVPLKLVFPKGKTLLPRGISPGNAVSAGLNTFSNTSCLSGVVASPTVSGSPPHYVLVPTGGTLNSTKLVMVQSPISPNMMLLGTKRDNNDRGTVKMMLVPSAQDPKKILLVPSVMPSTAGIINPMNSCVSQAAAPSFSLAQPLHPNFSRASSFVANTSNGMTAQLGLVAASVGSNPSILSKRQLNIGTCVPDDNNAHTTSVVNIKKDREDSNVNIWEPRETVIIDAKSNRVHRNYFAVVDLSLNFKSVKLGWLAGTLRKSILWNIRHRCMQNNGPTSFNVTNISGQQTIFAMYRRPKLANICLLLLGHTIQSVKHAYNLTVKDLFLPNGTIYYMEDLTGERSQYMFISADYLVKLGHKPTPESRKCRERVPVDAFRKQNLRPEVIDLDASSQAIEGNQCNCTTAGDFICFGHNTNDGKIIKPKKVGNSQDCISEVVPNRCESSISCNSVSIGSHLEHSKCSVDDVSSYQLKPSYEANVSDNVSNTASVTSTPIKSRSNITSDNGSPSGKSVVPLLSYKTGSLLSPIHSVPPMTNQPAREVGDVSPRFFKNSLGNGYILKKQLSVNLEAQFAEAVTPSGESYDQDSAETVPLKSPASKIVIASSSIKAATNKSDCVKVDESHAKKTNHINKEETEHIPGHSLPTSTMKYLLITSKEHDSSSTTNSPVNENAISNATTVINDSSTSINDTAVAATTVDATHDASNSTTISRTDTGTVVAGAGTVTAGTNVSAPAIGSTTTGTSTSTVCADTVAAGTDTDSSRADTAVAESSVMHDRDHVLTSPPLAFSETEEVQNDCIVDVECCEEDSVYTATIMQELLLHSQQNRNVPPLRKPTTGKRKIEGYDRPCPRSKKRFYTSEEPITVSRSQSLTVQIPDSYLPLADRSVVSVADNTSTSGLLHACLPNTQQSPDKAMSPPSKPMLLTPPPRRYLTLASPDRMSSTKSAGNGNHADNSNETLDTVMMTSPVNTNASSSPYQMLLTLNELAADTSYDSLASPKRMVNSAVKQSAINISINNIYNSSIPNNLLKPTIKSSPAALNSSSSYCISPVAKQEQRHFSECSPTGRTRVPPASGLLKFSRSSQPGTSRAFGQEQATRNLTSPVALSTSASANQVLLFPASPALLSSPASLGVSKTANRSIKYIPTRLNLIWNRNKRGRKRKLQFRLRGIARRSRPSSTKANQYLPRTTAATVATSPAATSTTFHSPTPAATTTTFISPPPPAADAAAATTTATTTTTTFNAPAAILNKSANHVTYTSDSDDHHKPETQTQQENVQDQEQQSLIPSDTNNVESTSSNDGGTGSRGPRPKDKTHNEMERNRRKEIGELFRELQGMLQKSGECEPSTDSYKGTWPKRMTLKMAIALLESKKQAAQELAAEDQVLRRQLCGNKARLQQLLEDLDLPVSVRADAENALEAAVKMPERAMELEQQQYWLTPIGGHRPESGDEEYVLDMDGSDSSCSLSSGTTNSQIILQSPCRSETSSSSSTSNFKLRTSIYDSSVTSPMRVLSGNKSRNNSAGSMSALIKNNSKGKTSVKSNNEYIFKKKRAMLYNGQQSLTSSEQQTESATGSVAESSSSSISGISPSISPVSNKRSSQSVGSQATPPKSQLLNKSEAARAHYRKSNKVNLGMITASGVLVKSDPFAASHAKKSNEPQSPTLSFSTLPVEFLPDSMYNNTLVGNLSSGYKTFTSESDSTNTNTEEKSLSTYDLPSYITGRSTYQSTNQSSFGQSTSMDRTVFKAVSQYNQTGYKSSLSTPLIIPKINIKNSLPILSHNSIGTTQSTGSITDKNSSSEQANAIAERRNSGFPWERASISSFSKLKETTTFVGRDSIAASTSSYNTTPVLNNTSVTLRDGNTVVTDKSTNFATRNISNNVS